MDTSWPKLPLLALILIVPVLVLIDPLLRHLNGDAATPQPSAGHVASLASTQGPYIWMELKHFSSHYWTRVAGFDDHAPPKTNGHDEFAADWVKTMKRNLHGLSVVDFSQPFPTPGFKHLPARSPGRNHILMIPGSTDPRRAVLIVAHYDGEPTSKGSTYDDTSGASITLAIAKVLGKLWRTYGAPALSVEFVLFDGEEQGLVGSSAYRFFYLHHALMPKPVMLIDEEQTGVGYPVRPFGLESRRPMPGYATTSYLPKGLAEDFSPITKLKSSVLHKMRNRIMAARKQSFQALRSRYGEIRINGGVTHPFRSSDLSFVEVGHNPICCSDNVPFEAMGLPTLTYSGDAQFYDETKPPWAYPFDQPQDTIRSLTCDTEGKPAAGKSLKAALTLPVVLSSLLTDSYASLGGKSGIGVLAMPATAGSAVHFVGSGASTLSWSFGDGRKAIGDRVSNTYKVSGVYTVKVRSKGNGATFRLTVSRSRPGFSAPFGVVPPPAVESWKPKALRSVPGCH